ncbi:MAG TPA: ABC transporter ATP-binding protein, partial [Candidatus Sulfotelmatobacter sp.]|nr:ABC transporter ATP-binding protein [Candidatus Sulfotelmatobacter sp.]
IKVLFDRALFCRHGCPQIPLLVELVALMVIIPVISGVISLGETYLTTRVGQRVMQDLRDAVYGHLQQMSLRFFTNTRTGEIQSRLTNDIAGVQQVVTDTTSDILSNVVSVVSTIIAMFILSWQLTVLTLSVVPFFLYFTNRAGKARRAVTMQAQEAKAHMTAVTEETLSVSGILLAKVFGRQRDELRRFQQENQKLADLAIRREMVGRVLSTVIHAAFSTSPAFVYLLAGFVIGRGGGGGALTAGTIVAFTTLQTRMFFPISRSLDTAVEALASLALFERIFDYLELHRDITEPSKPVRLDPATVKGSVRFANVSFRYDTAEVPISTNGDGATPHRTWALENVSFEVKPGQLAAIVGPSGAGKTTISYLVPRLYDVTKGAVLIDGIDVRELDFKSLSDVVGMVTQETYLFHASVRRNILYGRPDAGEEEVEEAARAAFIHDRIMELAEGYDTTVGERGYRMSGGEKQRIAIARLLLKAPRVLILDEATSALDTTSERLVQAALRRLEAGRTTIAIAHRLSTILAADVIFVLDRGRIIERGTHDELVRRGGLYARLYEQQFKSGKVEALCDDGVVLAGGEVVTEKTA